MATRQFPQGGGAAPSSPRALNQVQQVMRMLIWVGVFVVLAIILGAITALIAALSTRAD